MSHHTPVQSLPGTRTPDRTVGELVAERPGRSRVFQSLGIDFCCQGGRSLREACEKAGVPLESAMAMLDSLNPGAPSTDANPADLPIPELIRHVIETHHRYLRDELPRIGMMAARVARVHGGHTPSLLELQEVFHRMSVELELHLDKEEQILFPAIEALSAGAGCASLDGPLACMRHEHEETVEALARLRALTGGFRPPSDACNTYRALFDALERMEIDLNEHIRLENNQLFPAAEALMAEGAGGPNTVDPSGE